jgi:DNA-binding response OmpR family regulator
MIKILLIEDEEALRRALHDAFVHHGYDVTVASDGETGMQLVESEKPDLVILDIMLPGIDGFDVCLHLRTKGFTAPILILTARSEEVDRVVGLEIGADDYIVKPFSTRELLARVKAHLRRASNNTASPVTSYTFGKVIVDFTGSTVSRDRIPVSLTATELTILRVLVERKNKVVTRDQIMNLVWGYEYFPESRTVDTHILNLRQKLETDPRKPKHILTIHGIGYKFSD